MRRSQVLRVMFILGVACAAGIVGCSGIQKPRGARLSQETMDVTAYCSCRKCCGWTRTWYGRPVVAWGPRKGQHKIVGQTASQSIARRGTIAADTRYYPFGTVMFIPGYGYGRVEDRGGDIKGPRRIDLYFSSHREATRWGRGKKEVKIWLPKTQR